MSNVVFVLAILVFYQFPDYAKEWKEESYIGGLLLTVFWVLKISLSEETETPFLFQFFLKIRLVLILVTTSITLHHFYSTRVILKKNNGINLIKQPIR